jgi:hypothetical protein
MLNVSRALKSDRLFKSLTGLTRQEFTDLCFAFGPCFESWSLSRRKDRIRALGGGGKWSLHNHMDKLFFLLFYVKMYPTFDVAAFFFEVDRSQTNRWVHAWMGILEESLGHKIQLPERKIRSVKELLEKFPEIEDLLIDGTERPTQRPKNPKKQKLHYSGKKQRHTHTNLVITDSEKRILYLGDTCPGSFHDYKLLKKSKIMEAIPRKCRIWVDLGFQGIRRDYPNHEKIVIPNKKPKNAELSKYQKEHNQIASRARIRVEHAIGGVKRLQSLSQVYRNKKENFEDRIMNIGCGLWNLHLAN